LKIEGRKNLSNGQKFTGRSIKNGRFAKAGSSKVMIF
jgi:hypothetical protein